MQEIHDNWCSDQVTDNDVSIQGIAKIVCHDQYLLRCIDINLFNDTYVLIFRFQTVGEDPLISMT